MIKRRIPMNRSAKLLKNQSNFNKVRHEIAYSNLLTTYVDSASENLKIKKQLKIWFFALTMGSLCVIVILFVVSLIYACCSLNEITKKNAITINSIIGILTVVVPAISSLIVGFIKIPEIIARYLFNVI